MKKSQLFNTINEKVEKDLKDSKELKTAFEYFCKSISAKETNLREISHIVIDLAYTLKTYKNNLETNESSLIEGRIDYLTSEILIAKITPWIKQARKEIFKSEQSPFPYNLHKAKEWIIQKSKKPLPNEIQSKVNNFNNKIKELFDLIEKKEILGSFSIKMKYIPFPGEDGYAERFSINFEPDLEKLESTTSAISNATGFPQYYVVAFILTGIKPIIPRYRINRTIKCHQLPNNEEISTKDITIEINASDLTINEFKEIYKQYKEHLSFGKSKKTLTDKQKKLQLLITKKGTPPEKKGTKTYWEEIQREWNSNHPPKDQYKSWEGVYKAYQGIIKKV